MKPDNKAGGPWLYALGLVPVIWFALLIAPAISGGLSEIVNALPAAMNHPFKIVWCEDSVKTVLIFIAAYGLGIGIYLSSRRNYRRGEEHGSAKWGDPRAVNKKYRDKDPFKNRIFTQHVRMGLDGRKHRRNLNTLVVGGSGAGKSRFYAKVNICQCNTSLFILDCKGELLRDCGSLLERMGYEIKVVDLLNMEKSHCYNPFAYRDVGGSNDAAADTNAPVVWSQEVSGETNYLPLCVTGADYLINLANLKGHVYGMTLCAKNHFGSFVNSNRMRAPEGAGVHRYVSSPQMGEYTVLVDLMGNYQLGEKTMLYMLDALICAPGESVSVTGENSRWQQAPFNNDYTSSIFFSQDPLAIDSVGADFLMNEPTVTERNGALRDNPDVENYLHEAALVASAPSGTAYYNGNGERVENLGVHEHWNNSQDKQYSRNLGASEGIELMYLGPDE